MRLIEAGASAKVADRYGYTPLMEAVKNERVELAKALIAKGADVAGRDNKGWTALHVAALKGSPDATALLLAAGADVNARDADGYTPLMHAVTTGCLESARLLIARGTKLEVKNKDGETALDLAAEKRRDEFVELLLESGATREVIPPRLLALSEPCRREVGGLIDLFARSLDANYIVQEALKLGFVFTEESQAGAMFKSRNGILIIKLGSGQRVTSASYGRNGAGMGDVINLVDWLGGNVGKPIFISSVRREGKNAREPFVLLGAAEILVFPSGMDERYANRRRYNEEEFRRGLASYRACHFLTRSDSRASYEHLVVQTGDYSAMAATKLSSPHAKEVFAACFPELDSEKDWGAVIGEQVFGNYAPEGYEISDYSAFDRLVGEIRDGHYREDLVLRK
jgi:hypothetical protein